MCAQYALHECEDAWSQCNHDAPQRNVEDLELRGQSLFVLIVGGLGTHSLLQTGVAVAEIGGHSRIVNALDIHPTKSMVYLSSSRLDYIRLD